MRLFTRVQRREERNKPTIACFSKATGQSTVMYQGKTASDTLDDYIERFEGKTNSKYYTPKKVTGLLSPQQNSRLLETIEGRSSDNMNKGNKALLKWINTSYKDNLESTCKPVYNQVGRPPMSASQNEFGSYITEDIEHRDRNNDDTDNLSNLPSPDRSDNEFDSDQETVTTEVLLQSYNGGKKQEKQGGKSVSEYPSWVEKIDQSLADINDVGDSRRFSSVSSLLKSAPEVYQVASRSHDTTGLTMDDTTSIDTDVILQTSVYGEAPVNMGGSLHYPLFKDKRVEKLLNDSRVKKKKHQDNILGRSIQGISSSMQNHQSPQSRDVMYTRKILDKHRQMDRASTVKGRKVIGKTVDQLSRHSSQGSDRLKDASSTGKRTQSTQLTDRSYQRTTDRVQTAKGNDARSIKTALAKMKLQNKANKVETTKSSSGTALTGRQFTRQAEVNDGAMSGNVGTAQKQWNQTDAYRYNLFIPKATDNVELTSPRTSGYYSDMYLASPSTIPLSFSEGKLSNENIHKHISATLKQNPSVRRGSDLSASSVKTDKLMRQSPTGIKMHQRSKTWASSSFKSKSPKAMSTPKQPSHQDDLVENLLVQRPYHKMPLNEQLNDSVVDERANSRAPISRNSARTASSSAYRSATTARSFIQSRSQFSRSPLLSDNFALAKDSYSSHRDTERALSTSADSRARTESRKRQETDEFFNLHSRLSLQPKSRVLNPVMNNWKPSTSELRDLNQFVVAEDDDIHRENEAYINEKDMHDREVPTDDDDIRDADREQVEDEEIDEYDLSGAETNAHNRTWPSLERYKQKIKLVQSESKARSRPIHSGWVQEKRSIPLRSGNVIRTEYPLFKSNSTTYSARQTPRSSVRNREVGTYRSPVSNYGKFNGNKFASDRTQAAPVNQDLDNDSTTADTDILLVQPPMPIVDASPSLSTVSGDSTITDSQSEADLPLYADLPLRSSSRVSFAPDISHGDNMKSSLLTSSQLFNSRPVNSKYAGTKEGKNNFDSPPRDEPKAMKSELLDSFIEDCMKSTNGISRKEITNVSFPDENTRQSRFSGRDHPGTVETLKHMLLNLNGVTGREQTEEMRDEDSSTAKSTEIDEGTDETSSLPGEQSLTRAYHHLERLKSLISNRAELSGNF